MDLPTYTRIWRIEKRLYKLYDFRLPYPVSLVTIGVFVGTSAVWCLLLSLLGVPLQINPPWHVLWIVPPFVITFLATRPVIEGKSLTELLRSQLVYAAEAKVYTRLAPQREPDRIAVSALVWRRDPAAGPLPTAGGSGVRSGGRGRGAPAEAAAAPATEPPAAEAAAEPADTAAAPEPAAPKHPRPAVRDTGGQRGAKRTLSRRVLNYFGFGLEPDRPAAAEAVPPPAPRLPEPKAPATRRTDLAPARSRDDAPSPSFLSGRNVGDTAADEDWYAALGTASGGTPWPPDERTSGADHRTEPEEPDDEAARAEEERRAAEERAAARRRAEEIMSAPEPEPSAESVPEAEAEPTVPETDVPTQPFRAEDFVDGDAERAHQRAGRRLRGRAQGRTIARRMEHDRTGAESEAAAGPERSRSTGTGLGAALPATPEEAREEHDRARPRPRPHAAPWDLPPVARTTSAGVPEPAPSTASSPWDESRDAASAAAHSAEPEAEEAPAVAHSAEPERRDTPAPSTAASPWDNTAEPEGTGAEAVADRERDAADPDAAEPAGPAPEEMASLAARIRAGKPPLELDHGTGEHDSFTDVTRHRRTEETAHEEASTPSGPERPADPDAAEPDTPTPAPSKPRWELDHGTGAWEQIAAAREPDAADSEAAEPAGPGPHLPAPAAEGKPPLELDHGTGEHDSFTDVTRHRRTEEELAAIERAALRRRSPDGGRADGPETGEGTEASETGERTGGPATGDTSTEDPADETERTAPAPPPNRLARGVRSAGGPTEADDTPADDREPDVAATAPPDSERGLLTRFVDNARRVGGMLTPARGTNGQQRNGDTPEPEAADKPDLQLDHGTGEQQLFSGSTTPGGGSAPPTAAPDDRKPPAHTEDSPGGGTRGWRRLARVVTGGSAANSRPQLPPAELERLRTPFDGSRGLVVLGCTGGAGQTVTTLLLGHTLAAYRDDRVVAVDINPGPESLSRRVRTETPETLTSLLANTDALHAYSSLRGYTSQTPSGLEVVATLDDPYVQTLDDRDYATLTTTLRRHYAITLLDPAATGVARALPVVDGLVLVAPASSDAARSVALTFEWLDGHGYADLRSRAVVVINGVSQRSLTDVDAAEQVARGNCRAIVRVPWDNHIAAAQAAVDVKALRQTTRRAHAALAAVVAAGLAAPAASEANR